MREVFRQTIDPDGTICFHIEEIEEPKPTPEERQRERLHQKAVARNEEWLRSQWPRLIPECLGKWLGVGGQEAFIAPTWEEVLAWLKANHQDDPGAFVDRVAPRWQALFEGTVKQLESPRTRIEYHGPNEQTREYYRQVELRKRTAEWLLPHWPRLLPAAMGNYLFVAHQQTYVARSIEEGAAWIAANHADDLGALMEHVQPFCNERTYPHHAHSR